MVSKLLLVAALLGLLTGCPDGKDPPRPTITAPFISGTYTLGAPALACGTDPKAPELEHCDTLDPAEQDRWVEDNSWTPLATAKLAGFAMEKHEVTNAQYKFCEESGACTAPASDKVGGVDYYGVDAYDQHPVVNVSWEQARAYCKFVKRDLPKEAEWEVAARLDSDGKMRTFPYGAGKGAPTCSGNTYLVHKDCKSKTPLAARYSAADATENGVRDVASNVSEWVLDAWNPYAYCRDKDRGLSDLCPKNNKCTECGKPGVTCAKSCDADKLVVCKSGGDYDYTLTLSAPLRVVRGGSYARGPCALRLFVRRKAPPHASPEIGFRCVKKNGGPDAGAVSPDAGPSPDAGGDTGPDSGGDSGAEAGGG